MSSYLCSRKCVFSPCVCIVYFISFLFLHVLCLLVLIASVLIGNRLLKLAEHTVSGLVPVEPQEIVGFVEVRLCLSCFAWKLPYLSLGCLLLFFSLVLMRHCSQALAFDLSEACGMPDQADTIALLTSRLLFPKFALYMFTLPVLEPDRRRDAQFAANASWLRAFRPEDFGVEPEVLLPIELLLLQFTVAACASHAAVDAN